MFAIGLLASWLGTLCWNEASQRLPPTLVGQLIVFETLAALSYAFVLRGRVAAPETWAASGCWWPGCCRPCACGPSRSQSWPTARERSSGSAFTVEPLRSPHGAGGYPVSPVSAWGSACRRES